MGGPVPAWIPTLAVVGGGLLLFHFVIVAINLQAIFGGRGTAMRFIRFGVVAYILAGLLDFLTSFRGVAAHTQFTFMATAQELLSLYGAISMMFLGTIYYMVPRLTGRAWASPALTAGHAAMVMLGVVVSVGALTVAGITQGGLLLNAKVTFAEIFDQVRVALLINTAAQFVLLGANLLLLVNFFRTAWVCCEKVPTTAPVLFRPSSTVEAPAS